MDFELKKQRQGRIIPKKKTLSKQVKRSISLLIGTLLFLIVIFSIVYLLNTTQSNQKGYTLKQEQLRKDQLLMENRKLINNIIEAMSYSKIEASPIVKQMEKPDKIEYIRE